MPSRSRPLRWKLATWFVLVFFLIQATLVGGVVLFGRGSIERTRKELLEEAAVLMIENILSAEIDWDPEAVARVVPADAGFTMYAIRGEDGEVLVSHGVPDGTELPFTAWEGVTAGPFGGAHTRIRGDRAEDLSGESATLHLLTLPFRRNDEIFYFQATAREGMLERLLGPYGDLVTIGVPVGLLAAALAAWIIAGRAVAPMRELSLAARGVSPTRISERIDVEARDAEVAGLERELNSALERIEAGYRAQDQFIHNVSHELRTPIAVLLTQAQVAKMGERDAAKAHAFVDKAEGLLKRLGKLLDSFLVLAHAELTDPRLTDPVPAVDLVLGCLQACRELAEQSSVRLVSSLPDEKEGDELIVHGDAQLLQTMIENLVRNAIGHSPDGGEVALHVDRADGRVRFAVSDQGPGIPEEYLERVFDRFVRVPDSSARRDGTGLGLAIAHGVATLHGGSIGVRNDARGCTFTVLLPDAGSE